MEGGLEEFDLIGVFVRDMDVMDNRIFGFSFRSVSHNAGGMISLQWDRCFKDIDWCFPTVAIQARCSNSLEAMERSSLKEKESKDKNMTTTTTELVATNTTVENRLAFTLSIEIVWIFSDVDVKSS